MDLSVVRQRGLAGLARPRAMDWALAATVCALDLIVFSSVTFSTSLLVFALAIACHVPLAWRLIAPIPVFFIVWLLALGAALAVVDLLLTAAVLVVTYTVAVTTDRKPSLIAVALAVPAVVGMTIGSELTDRPEPMPVSEVGIIALLAAMLGFGPWLLGRRVHATRRRVRDAELATREAAETARTEERRQIALELHDIVSHAVSVMVLQADGARAVLHTDPDSADEALDHIATVGRSSVGELRRLLGVLTDGSGLDGGDPHTLADLPLVIEEAEKTGLKVRFEVAGRPPDVPASFERSVYRIVRETLANSRKHGGPGTHVSVCLFWGDDVLVVTTADDGTGSGGDLTLSMGQGLAGLRERVKASEGRLDAGPAADGSGYVVTATLPIPAVISATSPRRSLATGES